MARRAKAIRFHLAISLTLAGAALAATARQPLPEGPTGIAAKSKSYCLCNDNIHIPSIPYKRLRSLLLM